MEAAEIHMYLCFHISGLGWYFLETDMGSERLPNARFILSVSVDFGSRETVCIVRAVRVFKESPESGFLNKKCLFLDSLHRMHGYDDIYFPLILNCGQ